MNALHTAGNFQRSDENRLSVDSSRNVLSRIVPVPRADPHRAGEVAAKVVHIITACGLKSGDGLGTKEALRTRFRVSPGTMNEAVRILESRGVIETRRGLKGGLFVSNGSVQLTLKQAIGATDLSTGEHCRAVLRQLEPLLIQEAARAADAEVLEELGALLGAMDRSPERDRVSFLTHWREACGISTVYQEVNLIPHLSVAENICLGRQPTRFGKTTSPERMVVLSTANRSRSPHRGPPSGTASLSRRRTGR